MSKHLTHRKKRFVVAALAGLAIAAALCGCSKGPKFHDATVELGTRRVRLEHFLNPGAKAENATFVTQMRSISLDEVGKHCVTLAYGGKEETVTLTVQDTTAPEAVFVQERTLLPGDALKAEDFVEHMEDISGVSASFVQEPVISDDYQDTTVTVQVTDGNGNRVESQCRVSFAWMREELVWELGKEITKQDILLDAQKNDALLDQAELDKINRSGVGTYTLVSNCGGKRMECRITLQDTQGPKLELLQLHTWPKKRVYADDFVASVEDPSGVAAVELLTQINFKEKGTYPVEIRAVDTQGNETIGQTIIKINRDHQGPVFQGLKKDLEVEKYATPDYKSGVTAKDDMDGPVDFDYNADAVDLTAPGVYFVTYTAEDSSGNQTSANRRVVVLPDEADVQALVEKIAAELPDDPKEIRNYVWKKIRYSTNWGEPNATWHGFTKWHGNCYVHALCLQSIFEAKGYETHLIWTTNKTHYWIMVKLEEGWRHMDATPSQQHLRYLYMTDQQRKATLDGRNWDRSLWPKAE